VPLPLVAGARSFNLLFRSLREKTKMGRGKPPAAALLMSDRHVRLLRQEYRKRTTLKQYHTRISILLWGYEGKSNSWVGCQLGIDLNLVRCWRKRWQGQYEALLIFEKGFDGQGVSDAALLQTMLIAVQDLPRSGAPQRIKTAQKQQIVALACEKPESYGVMMTDWTHEMLAKVAMAQGIVETISRRHVGGILKKKRVATP